MKRLTYAAFLCVVAIMATATSAAGAGAGRYGNVHAGVTLRRVPDKSVPIQSQGRAVSTSADGHTVAVGAPSVDGIAAYGRVYVWVLAGTRWTLEATLVTHQVEKGNGFGEVLSLSADGQHLAIGDPYGSQVAGNPYYLRDGGVETYTRQGSSWLFDELLADPDPDPDNVHADNFGGSVALSANGSTMIVGAAEDDRVGCNSDGSCDGYGNAWSFDRGSSGWVHAQKLPLPSGEPRQELGEAVTIGGDGTRAAMTEPGATVNGVAQSGEAVTVVRTADGGWRPTALLREPTAQDHYRFGSSITMSADSGTIVVGSRTGNYRDHPEVKVFRRSGDDWINTATFLGHYAARFGWFGWSLALSADGTTLAVGAPQRGPGEGAVYRFHSDGSTWSYLGPTYIRQAREDAEVGWAVAVSADAGILFVGAPGYAPANHNLTVTGGVFVLGS